MFAKKLKELEPVTASCAYDPTKVEELYQAMHQEQEITLYPPPLFMFSPRTRVYRAKDIRRFTGYLNKFEPDGFDPVTEDCMIVMSYVVTQPPK